MNYTKRKQENQRLRGHQLLTQELRLALPPMYAGEAQGLAAPALVKFFLPMTKWYSFASEFDGADTFFGLVAGDYIEYGYFSLSELEVARNRWGLPVERDCYYKPQPLRVIEKELRRIGVYQ